MAKADYERAKAMYPSTSMDAKAWETAFDANPDIMWAIIGDIYDAVKTEEEKAAGIRRMGRRPARQGTSMEEVYRTVFPTQYSMDPFPLAFEKLLNGRSQRQFAALIPCDQGTISRLLNGKLRPDLVMLERVASVCKVPPYYFVEYRALYVGQLVTKVLTSQPNMGVMAMKRIRAGGLVTGRRLYAVSDAATRPLGPSVEQRMQDAAEARLQEVDEAFWALEENPDDTEAQERAGMWCGGCETCTVREVLESAIPILLAAIKSGEFTP